MFGFLKKDKREPNPIMFGPIDEEALSNLRNVSEEERRERCNNNARNLTEAELRELYDPELTRELLIENGLIGLKRRVKKRYNNVLEV